MDRVPPSVPNTASRLITMAVSLVGEAQAVALEMKCSATDFRDYLAGKKEPPMEEFNRLVDLVIREQARLIARNRELIAQARTHLKNS
jgi:hypothetical protein